MSQANPYTLAALAGLCAGEKHSLLNQAGIEAIAKNACAIGKATAIAEGYSAAEGDDFPHQDTQPAGAPGSQAQTA